jgi:CBS domain-containing protein
MKIQHLMTAPVRTCTASDSLNRAAQLMWEGDLGCLPVVDEAGAVIGMITDRDLAMAAHLRGAPLWALPVGEAMAKVVYSLRTTDGVRRAAKLMSEHQLRRLPIVDRDGKLAGILTLAGLACASAAKGKRPITPKEVGAVLAAISNPRPPVLSETVVVEVVAEPAPAVEDAVIAPAPRKAKSGAKPKAKTPTSKPQGPKSKGKSRRHLALKNA